jgi:glycosyltransferase involved in cell wall biosynthesis
MGTIEYPSVSMEVTAQLRLAYLAEPNEMLAREWMAFFAGRGHEVTLIARHESVIRGDLDPRISVQQMRPYQGPIRGRVAILDARRALRAVLASLRPDLVHVHDLTTGFGWMVRAAGFHPYVLTIWGSDLYLALQRSRASRLIGRLTLAGADLITMESRDLERVAIRSGAHPDRIRLIQFGVDTSLYRPADPDPEVRRRLGLENRRVLFAPRQIAPLYDHLSLVRAAARLHEDVVVLMSAKNAHPEYLREVETVARDLGLSDRLVIVPAIAHDDMAPVYLLADVVVSVPHSDSISVSVLEAMACGRLVVATDLPSPREWLGEVSPELLVPDGDPQRLGAALERALGMTPAERFDRGLLSRRIVVERAERESNMLGMERLYRAVVTRHRDGAWP